MKINMTWSHLGTFFSELIWLNKIWKSTVLIQFYFPVKIKQTFLSITLGLLDIKPLLKGFKYSKNPELFFDRLIQLHFIYVLVKSQLEI